MVQTSNAQSKGHLTGYDLLRNPRLNKGTAFTEAERRQYGLEGLLPPTVATKELQVARRHAEIAKLDNDLQKYLVLADLLARNETLFYAVVMSDPATYMPLVYTPTVGEACQKFAHIFRSPRGMYLPISARGRIPEILGNWPEEDVRFIVVTDGERILGLGDLGAGGMGIPIGKLALYTACAGVPPQYCLPMVLDVGTNNQVLLDDPLYFGLRHHRVRGEEYASFVDEFIAAVQSRYPKCCIQWEDFANINAVPILERYRDRICTYNDDIQGTAAVALAGILAGLGITKGKLTDQRFLFLGGGSAATGIAELISQAMVLDGLPIAAARHRNWLFDINGLMVSSRTDLADFQRPFAHDHAPIGRFVEAVEAIRPTGIIGVSTVPKLFNQSVIEAMARLNERPSSSRIRTRPPAPNARRRKLIAGPAAERFLPAAARSRRSRSEGGSSCRARETTSTSSRRWAWRYMRPKQPALRRRCLSSRRRQLPSRSPKRISRPD
jgi:malate dehydrogenase (oxaloacetate-decarboxylating)(NADP+)